MNIIDRFTIAHRHAEALMELGKKVGAVHGDLHLGLGSFSRRNRFRAIVYVSMHTSQMMTRTELEGHHDRALELVSAPYTVNAIYSNHDVKAQFTIEWVEPFCKQCGSNPVAYDGAIYCGAGCSARAEGGR